jgi:hypothetical protein
MITSNNARDDGHAINRANGQQRSDGVTVFWCGVFLRALFLCALFLCDLFPRGATLRSRARA